MLGLGLDLRTILKEEKERIMNKYLMTSIMITVGLVICIFAPLVWRLVGVFCIGGGCYVIIEAVKQSNIQRQVERYDRPTAQLQRSPHAEWKSLLRRPAIKTRVKSFRLHRRVTALARIFLFTIRTFA